jgi:hypothetical protein
MRGFSWWNVILIGLVVLLAALLIDANRADRLARAADDDRPGAAGGVIVTTGQYSNTLEVLYVIDTNQKTILVYCFHPSLAAGGAAFPKGELEFLAGRTYQWDTMAASKVTIGKQAGPTTEDTRKEFLKHRAAE